MSSEPIAAVAPTPTRNDVKEIRIALVCYGGVSLAVYMHGVTKELFKLVRAARAFDAELAASPQDMKNPFLPSAQGGEYDTEAAYFDALVDLAGSGSPTTVVIDVVTGTSAGGINGVCLAHGLAHGRSMANFRDLWLEQGSIDVLLEAHHHLHLGRKIDRMAEFAQALHHTIDSEGHAGAPLNGTLMSQLIYRALMAMGDGGPSLVRDDESLDLLVTTTDVLGFGNPIGDGAGHLAHTDASYRQLLRFHYGATGQPAQATDEENDGFTGADVAGLAFAARATSSFPGAFPSVSIASFLKDLEGIDPPPDAPVDRITRTIVYGDNGATDLTHRWYVDGGVLDNGPFDHALDAIASKRAAVQTARELIYIEPDPHAPHLVGDDQQPSWFTVVDRSKLTIPGRQVFVEALARVEDMNANVATVGAIVAEVQTAVWESGVKGAAAGDAQPAMTAGTTYDEMLAFAPGVRKQAKNAAGLTYGTYCRLRATRLGVEIGAAIADLHGYAPESNRARFVRDCVGTWICDREAFDDPDKLEALLGPVDHTYRRRRAQFMLQGINERLAAAQPKLSEDVRSGLLALKKTCWDLLDELRGVADRTLALPDVKAATAFLGPDRLTVDDALKSPEDFAKAHAKGGIALFGAYSAAMQPATGLSTSLTGSSRGLWDLFQKTTGTWDQDLRKELASRYLMWPIWDAMVFPVIELAQLPELSQIGVRRFSPQDAHRLEARDDQNQPQPKLEGVSIAHFGGFFERSRRENDYLWGRLDGVELIMTMLAQHSQGIDLDGRACEGLRLVLDSESSALTLIPKTFESLQGQLPTT